MKRLCGILRDKLELIGLEAPEEMQRNTMTQRATKPNPEKPNSTCHHCKKAWPRRKPVSPTQKKNKKLRDQKDTTKRKWG